jgi:hypothetical protein
MGEQTAHAKIDCMNQQLQSMRRDHNQLSISADQALAWHESGHAFAAASLGRLMAVTLRPERPSLGGQTAFDRKGLDLSGDWLIAAMGPAAQLLYTLENSKPAPSSFFVERYLDGPALGDHKGLVANWQASNIEQEAFLSSVRALAKHLGGNDEIFDAMAESSRRLLEHGELLVDGFPPLPPSAYELLDVVKVLNPCS